MVKESGIYLTEQDFLNNNLTLFSKDDASNRLEVVLGDVMLTRSGKSSNLGKDRSLDIIRMVYGIVIIEMVSGCFLQKRITKLSKILVWLFIPV